MTAAVILPISPFWQLRDSCRYDPDLQRLDLSPIWPDPYVRVWILWWYWQQWPTMWTYVLSASAVDKEIPVGVFISCVQLARKYQTARKYQGIYFMSGNDEGQISDTAHWVYRDHRDVHWTTKQTHSDVYDVYIRIHAYTRNVCTQACIRTYRRISKPHSYVQHLWDFLVFDQSYSSTLCACSWSKQTKKLIKNK